VTREDIIRMARKAGLLNNGILQGMTDSTDRVVLFAHLVAAAALEQPEQEPFGYIWPTGRHPEFRFTQQMLDGAAGMPLYNHPPRREWQRLREWRGLTEEEKRECAQAMDAEPLTEGWPELVKFARAIEAALKEKNHE